MILGVSTDGGVHCTLLSQIGRGHRKSFCFLCRSQVKHLHSFSLFLPEAEEEIRLFPENKQDINVD